MEAFYNKRRGAPAAKPSVPEMTSNLNLRYAELAGVEANLVSLDVYSPKGGGPHPVVIYVHGGSWRTGDKSHVGAKAARFTQEGFVFVSVNYRLSPAVQHPVHVQDVAKAVAWVHSHVQTYGGDPEQVFIMGHSSGAQLAALVATDERYLKAAGGSLHMLCGAIGLDGGGYDIPRIVASGEPGAEDRYAIAFGKDSTALRDASAISHVEKGKGIPSFLLIHAGQRAASRQQAEAMAARLREANVRAEVFHAPDKTHESLNKDLGLPADEPTKRVLDFLKSARAKDAVVPAKEASLPAASASGFAVSFQAGSRDAAGKLMGGTELRNLAAHDGKLYAGVETWMDRPGDDPAIGAQILVLDHAGGAWRLEHEFSEDLPGGRTRRGNSTKRFEGVTSLDSVTFATDGEGRALPKPVSILLAACRDFKGEAPVFARNDDSGEWVAIPMADTAPRASIRSFGAHRDRVTGVDHVFAGSVPYGIFSGVYDPQAPGKIRWEKMAELPCAMLHGKPSRPMAFADCNGELHLIMEPSLYRRTDGAKPEWKAVHTYPAPANDSSSGWRGLTAVPHPSGKGESLLAAMEGGPSQIVRIDPGEPYRVTVELDVRDFVNRAWGAAPRYFIVANNHMTWVEDRASESRALLISLQAHPAVKVSDAWYFVRREPGQYELRRVDAPNLKQGQSLCSTRTFAVSPFAADAANVVFMGGYDADNRPSHNTAWVARATVGAVLNAPTVKQGDAP